MLRPGLEAPFESNRPTVAANFAIGLAELLQRLAQCDAGGVYDRWACPAGRLRRAAFGKPPVQGDAASFTAALRAEHTPCNTKQPRQRLGGELVQAPPANHEHLSHEIVRHRRLRTAQDVRLDDGRMLAIQQLKPYPPLHAHVMAGSCRALHLGREPNWIAGVEDAGGAASQRSCGGSWETLRSAAMRLRHCGRAIRG